MNTERAGQGVALFRPKGFSPTLNNGLKQELQELGFRVFEFFLLKHELTNVPTPDLNAQSAYLFSSATGVEAFTMKVGDRNSVDLNKPVLAVGVQTAEAARAFGFSRVFAGSHGLKALLEEGWEWLRDQTSVSSLLSVGVVDPSNSLGDLDFLSGLSSSARDYYTELNLPYWPLYQTVPVTNDVEMETLRYELRCNLSKIKYFSFLSARNAAVFRNFLMNGEVCSDDLRLEIGQKTLVCNAATVADVFRSDNGLNSTRPLFERDLVSDKPNRMAYLALMKSLVLNTTT